VKSLRAHQRGWRVVCGEGRSNAGGRAQGTLRLSGNGAHMRCTLAGEKAATPTLVIAKYFPRASWIYVSSDLGWVR